MGQGTMTRQGDSLGNGPRKRGGVEAGAHRCSDGTMALRRRRRCSEGLGSSSGHDGAPGPAREEGESVSRGGTDERWGKGKAPDAVAYRWTGGLGIDEMQRWGSPLIGVNTGSNRMTWDGG
jgi:hypothetical protein